MEEHLQRYMTPQDIYARHMISHRGYPLWIPEVEIQLPKDYQDHGLKIGDVGYVVPGQGCFEVLFNIRLPLDHDLHRGKQLPRNFHPITLNDADIACYTDVEDAGCIISTSSVTTTEVTPIEQPSDYSFTLSSSEGALLILPQGADQHSLRRERLFGEYARKHAVEWYRFVEEDLERIVSHDSLYLITGFYKSSSWALASFQESEDSKDISARFKVTQLEGGDIVRGHNWTTTRHLNKRAGPKRYNGNANQAVYISGFKIAVRDEPVGRKKISVKVDDPSVQPHHEEFTDTVNLEELDEFKSDKSSESTWTSRSSSATHGTQVTQRAIQHVSLQRMPELPQPFHPSDIINQYLLQKEPSATVAITHDSQWIALLQRANGRLEPHNLMEERLVVEALSEKYVMTVENGAVFLQSGKGTTSDTLDVGDHNEKELRTTVLPHRQRSLSALALGDYVYHRASAEPGLDVNAQHVPFPTSNPRSLSESRPGYHYEHHHGLSRPQVAEMVHIQDSHAPDQNYHCHQPSKTPTTSPADTLYSLQEPEGSSCATSEPGNIPSPRLSRRVQLSPRRILLGMPYIKRLSVNNSPTSSEARQKFRRLRSDAQAPLRLSSDLPATPDPSIKPYACGHENCWPSSATSSRARFYTPRSLSDHNKVAHSEDSGGDGPYRCGLEGCGKSWKSINGLQYHLQISKAHFQHAVTSNYLSHYMSDLANSTAAETSQSNEGEDRTKKQYKCPHENCPNRYKQMSGLRYHLAHGHPVHLPEQLELVPPALSRKLSEKARKTAPMMAAAVGRGEPDGPISILQSTVSAKPDNTISGPTANELGHLSSLPAFRGRERPVTQGKAKVEAIGSDGIDQDGTEGDDAGPMEWQATSRSRSLVSMEPTLLSVDIPDTYSLSDSYLSATSSGPVHTFNEANDH